VVADWLAVAGDWAAIVAAVGTVVLISFGLGPWREWRRAPHLMLRVVRAADVDPSTSYGERIAQIGIVLELRNEGPGAARSWFVRFEFPRHPSLSGINAGDRDLGGPDCWMFNDDRGGQVLIWHARGEDDLLLPHAPRTFTLGAQLRGITEISIPFVLVADKAKPKKGTVAVRHRGLTTEGSVRWN
jgi:hypothetical protein